MNSSGNPHEQQSSDDGDHQDHEQHGKADASGLRADDREQHQPYRRHEQPGGIEREQVQRHAGHAVEDTDSPRLEHRHADDDVSRGAA
jgi:hypothetical protein